MKKDIILSVSKDLEISPDVVEKVYRAYWLYIKTTIKALPLKEDLTEEELIDIEGGAFQDKMINILMFSFWKK